MLASMKTVAGLAVVSLTLYTFEKIARWFRSAGPEILTSD